MSAGAGRTGVRAWLGPRRRLWLTPRRMRALTMGLLAGALVASSVAVTGSTPKPVSSHAPAQRTTGAGP